MKNIADMKDSYLLRIFISENDKYKNKPLYEEIVLKAKELRISGATVTRGILGYGKKSHLHSAKILALSEKLPIIIEIIDNEDNLNILLANIDNLISEGLFTLEKIKMFQYIKN